MRVNVVGGGLAGCEAAYQLLKRGYDVHLYEMRGVKNTPCHDTDKLCELVCSNSLKSKERATASGALKLELAVLDSLVLRMAYESRVPAGGALAVNRLQLSEAVERELMSYDNLKIIRQEYIDIDDSIPTIIASGPLTSDNLAMSIMALIGDDKNLHFYDAVAPIISGDSLDMDKVFAATRYDKGDGSDYLNCGMNREQYQAFYEALVSGTVADTHEFEKGEVFESCMPIEVMAKRGAETIRYGMMKPVGITNPNNGERYYAVVQLRKENVEGSAYNIVGFQTNLTFKEQRRIFSLIPGLENAEFLRYGVIHRNTFLNSPMILDNAFNLIGHDNIYFAGQITGVEGYVESIMSGLISAINYDRKNNNLSPFVAPIDTITGALQRHITATNVNFQPMNANFGILPELDTRIRDKKERKLAYANRCEASMIAYVAEAKL